MSAAVFYGVVLIMLVGVGKVVLRDRLARRHHASLDVVMVVTGFVLLLMMRVPVGHESGGVGIALFVALPVVYRLLGHFEEPDDRE